MTVVTSLVRWASAAGLTFVHQYVLLVSPAQAQARTWPEHPELTDKTEPPKDDPSDAARRDVKLDIPQILYTQSAFGVHAKGIGVQGRGGVFGASGRSTEGLGGGSIFGSPIDRLTLMAATDRKYDGRFAPSACVSYRFFGSLPEGWALGASARYKLEGFSEAGGELESGVLFSIAANQLHFDVNAIIGFGLEEEEEEGEVDTELKLRAGYDLLQWLRIGVDGQARMRVSGEEMAPGGRTWDAVFGPQVLSNWGRFYLAATGGPTTMGVADGVGWSAFLTVGGVTL